MKKYSLPGIILWEKDTNSSFLATEGNVYFGRFHLNYTKWNKVYALASIYSRLPPHVKSLFLEDLLKNQECEELALRVLRVSSRKVRKKGLKKILREKDITDKIRSKAKVLLKQFGTRKPRYGVVNEKYKISLNGLEREIRL